MWYQNIQLNSCCKKLKEIGVLLYIRLEDVVSNFVDSCSSIVISVYIVREKDK